MPGLICMEASAPGSIIQGTDVRSLRLLRGAVPPPQLMSGDQPSGSTPGMGPSAVYSQRRSGPKKRSSGVRLRRYAQYSASNSKIRRPLPGPLPGFGLAGFGLPGLGVGCAGRGVLGGVFPGEFGFEGAPACGPSPVYSLPRSAPRKSSSGVSVRRSSTSSPSSSGTKGGVATRWAAHPRIPSSSRISPSRPREPASATALAAP